MLNINEFRENPEKIKKSEMKRGKDPSQVDKVVELDKRWREVRKELDELRHQRNRLSDKVAEKKRQGKDSTKEIEKVREMKDEIERMEEDEKQLKKRRDEIRYKIGNILDSSVPEGEDEEENVEIRREGEKEEKEFEVIPHADFVRKRELVDEKKAGQVAGSRFYYLKKDLVALNLALQQFALDKLEKEDFVPMQTPYMLKEKYMSAAAELSDFEEQLYKVKEKSRAEKEETEDSYLIATSEQTLASYHYDEIFEPDELPLKYAGISTCFRREAGSHGKDTKGIFRVHQFEKVEQYVFCDPVKSWDFMEKLRENAEEILKDLNINYRVVNVCSGDMNDNAAKKYDLEAWFPSQERYRELVSCSNCTDYQARKLNIRMRGEENPTVHTLNSTALASQRTICAILEQNQREDGSIEIPDVLSDYLGKDKINSKDN